jgi:manganese/iron transport system substrate-binding protein
MSPNNALIYFDNIAAAMSLHGPDNASSYSANAESTKAEITATIAPLREQILTIPEDERWLVTCEGAFSYLARDFGLKEAYLWPMNADQTRPPQQVRSVINIV